jgi:hypothetical protein
MRVRIHAALLLALLAAPAVRADTLPSFHPSCTYKATHVIVVETQAGKDGSFRVVATWKGDLKKGDTLTIRELAKEAKGEMVLFLRRNLRAAPGEEWKPASVYDWQTSVAWLEGDTVKAVQQRENPGPAEVLPLEGVKSREHFKDVIFYYLRTEQQFEKVKGTRDEETRVALLAEMVNGAFDRKEEAFAQLGRCGPKAVPVLRKFLKLPLNHQQKYAVTAFAAAGGKEVAGEINEMIDAEMGYWKETGPTLTKGWWFATDGEPWIRYGRLSALVSVYRTLPSEDLKKRVVEVRDFFSKLPSVRQDQRIGQISELCERVLNGEK